MMGLNMEGGSISIDLLLNADQVKFKDFIRALGNLNMSSILASVGLNGVYETIKNITNVADATAVGINNFTKTTFLSGDEMQRWGYLAKSLGGNADEAKSGIKGLQDNLDKLRLGLPGAETEGLSLLAQTGHGFSAEELSKENNAYLLMKKINEAMTDPNVDDFTKRQIANFNNLNDSMRLIGMATKEQVEDATRLAVVGEVRVKTLMKEHAALTELGDEWHVLMTNVGARLIAPWLTDMIKDLNETLITGKIKDEGADWTHKDLRDLFKAPAPGGGRGFSNPTPTTPMSQNLIDIMGGNNISPITASPITNEGSRSQTTHNDFDISISGVSDPKAVKDEVMDLYQEIKHDKAHTPYGSR